MVGAPRSTSHNSIDAFSHPIIIPRPSQSQETLVGFTFPSSSEYLKDALNGDRECNLVSQIFTVPSAAAEASKGCCVPGTERLQIQFVCPSNTEAAAASTTINFHCFRGVNTRRAVGISCCKWDF